MGIVEILGFIAGGCVVGSMALKNVKWIKILLIAGSVLFLTYGIILMLYPIIFINTIGLIIGIISLIRLLKATKRA
jgi:uncharacterized protein with PQ loop repeat